MRLSFDYVQSWAIGGRHDSSSNRLSFVCDKTSVSSDSGGNSIYLGEIVLGQNLKYTSERFMQEIVLATCMGEVVLEPIKEEIQTSPVFSLLINETTDVSIIKQMIVYGCYIANGKTKTRFLGIVEISDGRAITITDAVMQF